MSDGMRKVIGNRGPVGAGFACDYLALGVGISDSAGGLFTTVIRCSGVWIMSQTIWRIWISGQVIIGAQ